MLQNFINQTDAESLEIKVYDDIGRGGFFWDEISAQSIINQVEATLPKNITLRINSGGGSVFEGLTIYNYLKSYNGRVKVVVDGLAASIASIIAMAGNRIEMGEGALMMIHDPMSGVMGNAAEMRKMADVLDKVGGSLADIYVNKTGLDKAKVLQMMSEETWLTAQEAVEMGFANKAIGAKQVTNENLLKMVARYNAPQQIVNSITSIKMEESKSFVDRFKDFFNFKKEFEAVQNEMNAPIVSEYEAKLQAEKDARTALEAKLAAAEAMEAKVAELQAKIDTMQPAAAPVAQQEPDPTEQEPVAEPSKFEALENSLKSLMTPSQIAKAEKSQAMANKIAEIQNKRKQK